MRISSLDNQILWRHDIIHDDLFARRGIELRHFVLDLLSHPIDHGNDSDSYAEIFGTCVDVNEHRDEFERLKRQRPRQAQGVRARPRRFPHPPSSHNSRRRR